MTESSNPAARRQNWKQDPDKVRKDIVEAATKVFAELGLTKTRIDDIAAETETSKRMIYYYFGDKEQLYLEVLARAYEEIGRGEDSLSFEDLDPIQSMERLVGFLFDHIRSHPEFVRILMVENIHKAVNLKQMAELERIKTHARVMLSDIYRSGVASGVFRPGLDVLKLRWLFSGLSFFNVSNRPSFEALFGDSLWQEEEQQQLKQFLIESVLGYMLTNDALIQYREQAEMTIESTINPELEPFLAQWDGQWAKLPADATIQERRARFETIAANMRLPTPPEVDTEQVHWVETESGPVRVRVFRHRSHKPQPCLIYMHGGAWLQGSPETHWDITARVAADARCTVISVDYALAPERPFPAAANQCRDVVRWVHAEAGSLGVRPDKLFIGGDSAGGNLAAVVTLDLRGSDVQLAGQMLFYPACDFDMSRLSYTENAEAPLLQTKGMDKVNAMYCPVTEELTSPRVAPLCAESHSGLPPAFVTVAQYDPIRDSGQAYIDALTVAGVPVQSDSGQGLIHGYLRAMEYCAASREKLRLACQWLVNMSQDQ